MRCGLSAKKSKEIHAKKEWCLIINALHGCPWRRPGKRLRSYVLPSRHLKKSVRDRWYK